MADLQVTCINKPGSHSDPWTRIRNLGGPGWKSSENQVINEINRSINRYFVRNGDYAAWLEVQYHNGNPYLRTIPDGTHIDNLLFLGECA